MRLASLLGRSQLTILGLNSGTSADGLDLAVIKITRDSKQPVTFLHGIQREYPKAIREIVLQLADGKSTTLDGVVRIDSMLGQFFGKTAALYLKQLTKKNIRVDAIASHGQTVRHLPHTTRLGGYAVHGTLQLGSPAQIAALTGKVTVGDVRQADIALGNEGAPITVAAVARLFGHPKESRLIVNVGGMSNFFYLPAGTRPEKTLAADCGPGNVLSDLLSQSLFGEKYDRNGRRARKGRCSKRLLSLVTGMQFFQGGMVSTGRELFGQTLAERLTREGKRLHLSLEDILATAVEITAFGICRKIQPLIKKDRSIRKLYLTGGGSFNRFLKERIAAGLDSVEVSTVAELGMDPSLTEAASYAVIGAACLWSQPMPIRFGSGKQPMLPILGIIAQPPV